MTRRADLLLAVIAAVILAVPLAVIAFLVRLTSRGPALYWSDRVGQENRNFSMPKFRTMRLDTPVVATHLLTDARSWLTPIGGILRRTSLDELPQLWCVIRGDMSFVGPRPALYSQYDLIAMRTDAGVHLLLPGITGWAQINGRDELSLPEKVKLDAEYLARRSFWFDRRIIVLTAWRALAGHGVAH